MLEYLKRRGLPCHVTDRELRLALGLSQGAVSRLKVRLARQGLITYVISSRHGGTEYLPVQSAEQSGAKKSIYRINTKTTIEREMRARPREAVGEDAVLAAWAKYRGRVLIEDEQAEMASWREKLGESRLIELIAAAWRRCTADRMSFGYFADYFIAPALSGAKKAVQKAEQKAKLAVKERSEKHDERRSPAAVEKPAGEVRKSIWADAEPAGDAGDILSGKGNKPMQGLLRVTVRKGNGKMPAAVVGNGVRAILRDEDRMHVFASEDDSGAEQRIGRAAQICGEDV